MSLSLYLCILYIENNDNIFIMIIAFISVILFITLKKCNITWFFQVKSLVFDYIVNEMCSLRTCEKPSFKNLIVGLTGLNDTIIPNRKQLSKELDCKYETYISMLTNLIAKHSYICTTADIWSTNNRSYLGNGNLYKL